MEKIKRYSIFILGLFINSLGVSLITKADLGTSPISAVPYVLSLKFPMTLGQFTILFSILLILIQLIILKKNFKLEHSLQIPISVLFGYFIDLTMFLLSFVEPDYYPYKIIYLLIGCLILGFGVYMEVLADVAMLPGESFVRAIVMTWKTRFGTTKIAFDVTLTITAALLSFIFFGRLTGVREGTVIAALLVGFIARIFGRLMLPVKERLFPEAYPAAESDSSPLNNAHHIIVIGRQYGSGGHDLGKLLAEKLGYAFYDKDIMQMVAGSTGYTPEFIKENEETMKSSLLYDLLNQMYVYSSDHEAPKDAIFQSESDVIRELASKENCVIVGRCADYILRDHPNCLRVFLHAPLQFRINRIMRTENLDREAAKQKIMQTDKERADHYHYYTHNIWGLATNYDITLNTEYGESVVENLLIKAQTCKENISRTSA